MSAMMGHIGLLMASAATPPPASRYLRILFTNWVFNGGANVSDLGDIRVQQLAFKVGASAYPAVPMTANNAPSPLIAFSSGAVTGFGDHEPYQAFDHSTTGDQWMGDGTVAKYLGIDLGAGNDIAPDSVEITPDNAVFVGSGYYITGFKVQGSSTGAFAGEEVTYKTITGLVQSDWAANTTKTFSL